MLLFYLSFVIFAMFWAMPLTLGCAALCHFAFRDRPLSAFIAAALGGFVIGGTLSLSRASVEGVLSFGFIGAAAISAWWVIVYVADGLVVRLTAALKTSRRGRVVAAVVLAVVAASAVAYDLTYAARVLRSAEARAGGARSCITIPRLNRQARAWSDLRYTALPRGGSAPHALLLVDEGGGRIAAYHWSFWQGAFEPDWRNSGGYGNWVCRPKKGYAQSLPLWPVTNHVEVQLQGRFLYVPLDFRPTGWSRYLSIRTEGPDFTPHGQSGQTASIRPAEGGLTNTFTVFVRPRNVEYGLTKVWMPANAMFPEAEYRVEQDGNGAARTFVQCLTFDRCSMNFVEGGFYYTFAFPKHAMRQWREMRAKCVQLFRSFEAEPR